VLGGPEHDLGLDLAETSEVTVSHRRTVSGVELTQVAQRVEDLDRAIAFYSRLLGNEPAAVFEPPGLAFFRLGSGPGAVRLLLERGAPSAMLYLQVDDVRTRIEELRAEGVAVVEEPHVIFSHADDALGPAGTDEWMGFFRDSEDNLVGLVSHSPSAQG
jgi:methylmalonyl-CoA/ethylmalonyl-CoA epimerase